MTSMSHEQGVTLLNAWIPTLVAESRTTRSVLAAVPADQGDYRPDPVCKSAMELVRHIAVADNRFIEGVLTGEFPHTIHHRGQLSSYLRPMGAKVPAIYGESFDSAALKAARPA